MNMLELLRSHLKTSFSDFQEGGNSFAPLSPYLKQDTEKNLPSEEAVKVILKLPEMLEELCDIIRQENVSPQTRAIAGGIYSYVFNPFDYIDDDDTGYLGFVDDVLIVFYGMRLLERIDAEIQFLTCNHVVSSAIKQWEKALSPEILATLESYPDQLSNAIGAT